MRKILMGGVVPAVVMISLLATFPKAAVGASKGAPIKIGVLAMNTGDMASKQYGDLARLAAKDINAKGGANGRPIEIVEEDEAGSPEKAILAFTKLVERDNVVLVIGPVFTHVAAALQPKANQKKVPLIGFNFGTILDKTAGGYYFRHMASDDLGSEALIKYMLTKIPASDLKVGIIHDKTPVGASSRATFTAALTKSGMIPVGAEAFEMGTVTFIPYLQKLKNSGANAIFPGTVTGPVMGIMRDLGVMGWRPLVVGGLGFGNTIGYHASGGLWNGVVYWSFLDFSRKDVRDFAGRVKKELNQTFEGESTVQFYDIVKLAGEVLKKSGSDREAFRNALENFSWDKTLYGPRGTVAQYSAQRHVGFGRDAHVINQWNPGGTVKTIWRTKK